METIVLAGLAGLAVVVALWLFGPPLWQAFRRWRITRRPFPAEWRRILRHRMPAFARLPADLQLQLKRHVQVLVAEKPFIGCRGLEITEEMRVLIAAQAGLLLLNRPAGYFRSLRQVLVYPSAFVVERPTIDAAGVTADARHALVGESWQQGQVILSWADVLQGASDADDGRNVVIHEFAHQLDQEAGAANGAPWLPGRQRRERWARTFALAFAALQAQVASGEPAWLDAYGATNPAECFAVASEQFFEQPEALRHAQPAVYAELAALYHVDPLAWY